MKAILLCLLPVWRGREKGAAYGVPRQSSPSKVRKNWNETTTPNPRKGLLVPSLYPRKKSTKDATVPLTVHGPQGCLQMLETNLRKLDGPKVKKSSAEESRSNASPLQTPGIRGRGAPSADAEAPELPGPLHSGAAVCAPRSRVCGTRRPPLAGSHGSDRMNRQQRLRGKREAGGAPIRPTKVQLSPARPPPERRRTSTHGNRASGTTAQRRSPAGRSRSWTQSPRDPPRSADHQATGTTRKAQVHAAKPQQPAAGGRAPATSPGNAAQGQDPAQDPRRPRRG